MRRSLLVLGAVALTLTTLAAAPQSPSAPPQQPIFRAGVDYVRVDVVVTDKADRPITDLTKSDFEITEGGRPQTIDDFQFISVPVERRAIDVTSPASSPPDVSTNTPPSPKSRLFVMIIDDLHIVESDIINVKKVMTDFLSALTPDDEVAIVFTGHSNLSQNFTTDRGLLMKTIGHVREALGFGLDALGRSNTSNLFTPDRKIMGVYAREADFVLKNVAQALAGSGHSRRAIVYVTDGSILSSTPVANNDPTVTDYEYLQDAYDAARRADVPIYTIDPRGQPLPEDAVRGGISATGNLDGSAGETLRGQIAANIQKQVDRLAEVAVNTGGRAFTRQSNLTRAIDEIVGDNGSYYLLGYYPSPFSTDGKFHELKVHVNRPGVRVRARQGYVASAATPAATDAKPMLDAAMSSGVNVSGLSLRAFAAPLAPGAKGTTTAVAIEVTYPAPADGSRRIDDHLQTRIVALDPDAKVKASSARELRFTGTAPSQNAVTFFIDDVIELPAQPLTLRVGVASGTLGKAGTVQFPVDVPKMSDSKLQLSGVAIGFAGAPREAVMRAEALAPLIPFQPTTSRTFAATDTLRVFARTFWGSKDGTAQVTVGVTGPSTRAPQTMTLTGTRSANGHQEGTLDTTLPLAGLAPGAYVLTLDARLGSGQATRREVPFTIR